MESSQHIILDYFYRELDYLRTRSKEFSEDYPKAASELSMCRGQSSDPHIEMLMQSFAFLTGRLHYLLDKETSKIAKNLLTILYPHLTAPVPSMSVVQAEVVHDGANFLTGYVLEKNSGIYTNALSDSGRKPKCRFRTCYHTELWPFEIMDIGFHPANQFDFLKKRPEIGSVLKVKIRNNGNDPVFNYPLDKLRFFINSDTIFSFKLYDILNTRLSDVAVCGDRKETPQILPGGSLSFVGFEEEDALFPDNASIHPAYRLLQEYFLFPEKFLFFDVHNLCADVAAKDFEILFLFDSVSVNTSFLKADSLAVNCVPVINLFSANINPIALDYRNFEYRIVPDIEYYRYNEIFSITEMSSISPTGKPRKITSYFSQDANGYDDSYDYFWTFTQKLSPVKSRPGTETFVSFHDHEFDMKQPVEDVISAKALCTNRRLPESMNTGLKMILEGPGPVRSFQLLMQPTRHMTPENYGMRIWHLVSQLVLNHLSLDSDGESLKALKSLLNLYSSDFMPVGRSQVESIDRMETRKTVRHMGDDAWRGFCRGTKITLTFDETVFQGGSPLLFGEVLNRFFALYTTVNSFTELVIKSKQRKGIWKRWKPVTGDQAVI
ncbi:MAG: type VI secretion system baseplate subunit TssF [Desulfobacterales bacterium]|nr:type VI secretion system baseplate subunit TssF [Desulfobacterales bacterium]